MQNLLQTVEDKMVDRDLTDDEAVDVFSDECEWAKVWLR